ncbi:MAG TPA: hypothetical protein VM165_10320 [Planctomycetaceae bacterium]|nr:hypothetical protein [Planctomycetaceae bacterium]
MKTVLLSDAEFAATFAEPMRNVTDDAGDVIDIWPYVDAVPTADLCGHEVYDQFVDYVYRDGTGCFDHVLVMTRTKNVYLAVVVDLTHQRVFGHHLLDLNKKYGLSLA